MELLNFKFTPENSYFTSDTHFCHANIIRFCNRPFVDVEQMNEILIENWNKTVPKDATIFHLGDFCFGGSAEWSQIIDRLNGKIFLIVGNHERKNLRQGFMKRFEHVAMQMQIEIEKQAIYLNHYPFLCYGGSYRGVWQLFGHVHTSPHKNGKDHPRLSMLFPTQYDVGVDNNNYAPVSFTEVKQIIEKQITESNQNETNS